MQFLNDPRLEEVIGVYLDKEEVEETKSLMARRFLMCSLMFKNAQRQGAVVNLWLDEYKRAVTHSTKTGENVYIYKVSHHKTMGHFGSANLVAPENYHHMLGKYINKHRPKPSEGNEDYVFLTPQGKLVAHISDDLRSLSKDFPTSLGVLTVIATDMRKFTASEVAQDGSEEMVRRVATHMTHGENTARKYYRHIQGVQESVDVYSEVTSRKRKSECMDGDRNEPVVVKKPKRRKMWLKEEEDEIKKSIC